VEGNPIKGRNILLKAGKALGKNDQFWVEFIKYELFFLRMLYERKKILVGGEKQEDTEDFLAFDNKPNEINITNENEEKSRLNYIHFEIIQVLSLLKPYMKMQNKIYLQRMIFLIKFSIC
jgi:hypothetical protein